MALDPCDPSPWGSHLHQPGDRTHPPACIRWETSGAAKVPQMKIKYLLINLGCEAHNPRLPSFSSTGRVAAPRAPLLHD